MRQQFYFKTILILTITLSIFSARSFAQTNATTELNEKNLRNHSVQLIHDFFFTLSINYEQLFIVGEKSRLGFRAGVGSDYGDKNYEVIGGAIYLYGKSKHFLEAGINLQYPFYYREEGPDPATFALTLGYRYQAKSGLIFRVYPEFIPAILQDEDSWGNLPFLGFAIGYSF